MNPLRLHTSPYLFAVTCKGRRGVVVGTHMKDTWQRAQLHFLFFQ